MGDYDAPPHERIENVRAERDAARQIAENRRIALSELEDERDALIRGLAQVRAAFAADLARAEAEYERLASAARALLDAKENEAGGWMGSGVELGFDTLAAALRED